VRLLLDTHALLWWALDEIQLSSLARHAIADGGSTVYVSAVSACEIAIKVRIGKLQGAEQFSASLREELHQQGFHELPISIDHAQRAGCLPGPHRDPFDRLLIAQAQAEKLTLVSNERIFDQYGVVRLW
jgi:PIN domain nuclease of toxin-antitoxin system